MVARDRDDQLSKTESTRLSHSKIRIDGGPQICLSESNDDFKVEIKRREYNNNSWLKRGEEDSGNDLKMNRRLDALSELNAYRKSKIPEKVCKNSHKNSQ